MDNNNDKSSFGILAHNLPKVHNLVFVDHAYVNAHGASEKLRGHEKC